MYWFLEDSSPLSPTSRAGLNTWTSGVETWRSSTCRTISYQRLVSLQCSAAIISWTDLRVCTDCPAENVGRLKQLQYLNLALNNVERIENLEGITYTHTSKPHKLYFQMPVEPGYMSMSPVKWTTDLQSLPALSICEAPQMWEDLESLYWTLHVS